MKAIHMMNERSEKHFQIMQFLPIILLVIMVIFFSLLYPTFFSRANIYNILRQMSFLMVVSMGMTIVILMGSIDASVGANVTFSGTVAALAASSLGGWALIIGICCGGLVGLVNGLLTTRMRIPSFLATLSMMGALNGIALLLMKSSPINVSNKSFLHIANGSLVWTMPNVSLVPIVAVIITVIVVRKTSFGRVLFAIGGNEQTTQYSGIRVRLFQVIAFIVSGLFAGLAGTMEASMFEAACPYMGESLMMNAIAAVVIGGTPLTGGSGGPLQTVLGVVIIAILGSGMNFMGLEPATKQIVTGLIMIIAVAVNIDRSRMAYVK